MSEEPLWQPDPEAVAATRMAAFRERVQEEWLTPIPSYEQLWRWSVGNPDRFWATLWDHLGVIAHQRGDRVVEGLDKMPGTRWFPGARLNFAENLLRFRDETPALIARDERGRRRQLSFRQLRGRVAGLAAWLRARGVGPGDRVAAFLPNVPEAVIGMLAAASVGATWSSCSPDFGRQGVLDRFGQIEPKVLLACDGYTYAGKRHDTRARVAEIVAALSGLQAVLLVSFLDEAFDPGPIPGAVPFEEAAVEGNPEALLFEPLPFDHPLYILYSSGTTGLPKCIVHGAGGTLLQHLKELALHTDLRRGERLFYFTTCGWMMWNWLVSGLAVGATVCLYEGAPGHPDLGALWRLAEAEGLAVFGTSPRFLAACQKAGLRPGDQHDLGALRAVLSTGAPLAPEQFDWVYDAVKPDLQLASISGGTDIVSCFALGNPAGPVFRGQLQTRGLGMNVDVFDPDGNSLVGQPGELVCKTPFPSMPVGFHGDPDGARYRKAYFERFPGVWHHGDFAALTPEAGVVVYGRSDATLNPGGVRIGTAEIYRQVEALDEVVEAVVIGQRWQDDVRVVLFVRLREGLELDDELRQAIRAAVRAHASPRHVPARILQVPDVPRTLSGKVVELAVRDVVEGREVPHLDALANPEALEHFRDRPELST